MRTRMKVQIYITKVFAALIILFFILSFIKINLIYSKSAINSAGKFLIAQEIEPVDETLSQDKDIDSIEENPEDGIIYEYRKGMVSAGLYHTILLNEKGKVFTWGDNTYGQLGLGSLDNEEAPTEISGLTDVVAVSAGAYHSMALTADGNVYLWGRNSFGQIGNKSTETVFAPVRISDIPPIKEISAGGFHSLALTINGDVYGWGNNTDGQIGIIKSEEILDEAQNILGLRAINPQLILSGKVVSVSSGGFHSLALMEDGSVFAWGDNTYGQLGDGTTQSRNIPKKTQILNSVVKISAGYHHSFAITKLQKSKLDTSSESKPVVESGSLVQIDNDDLYYRSLYTWGSDSSGQLGLGVIPDGDGFISVPRRVNISGEVNPENDNVQIAVAGFFTSFATIKDVSSKSQRDNLYVWGNNAYGQLGIGALPSRNIPLKLAGTSNGWSGDSFLPFQSISAGGYHTVLLSVKGFLGTMGRADKGQLGNTSTINADIPVGISVEDGISPEWKTGEEISVRNQQIIFSMRWNSAKDNIKVAEYEINYTNIENEPVSIVVQENLESSFTEYSIRNINPQSNQIITVFALDAQGNKSTRPLRFYLNTIPNAGADEEPENQSHSWTDRFGWSAENYGEIEKLEVPWDVDYIYGIGTVMPPPDNSLIIAMLVTLIVLAFFMMIGILAFKKNHKDIRIFGDIIRFRSRKYFKENDKKTISEYNNEVIKNPEEEEIEKIDTDDVISIEITETDDEGKTGNNTFGLRKFFSKRLKDKNNQEELMEEKEFEEASDSDKRSD